MSRFVNIKELQELIINADETNKKISSYQTTHCKKCGDTKPKHGFYPLFSSTYGISPPQTSMLTCNRCRLSDEEYLRIFKEEKEKINLQQTI